MAEDRNDQDASPQAVRDPLQAAVRLLVALIVVALIGLALWALFFREAEFSDVEPVGESAVPSIERSL